MSDQEPRCLALSRRPAFRYARLERDRRDGSIPERGSAHVSSQCPVGGQRNTFFVDVAAFDPDDRLPTFDKMIDNSRGRCDRLRRLSASRIDFFEGGMYFKGSGYRYRLGPSRSAISGEGRKPRDDLPSKGRSHRLDPSRVDPRFSSPSRLRDLRAAKPPDVSISHVPPVSKRRYRPPEAKIPSADTRPKSR